MTRELDTRPLEAAGPRVEGRDRPRPAAEAPPVVELRGVHKAFPGHLGIGRAIAVDGIDLAIRRGEILGLLGPNGAGKTTTLKMILGLLRPDRGTLTLFGLPPTEPAARARLGYLPEHPYFYDYLTAREFLDFYGRLRGIPRRERRERVREAIRRVGLEGREDVPLRKFSKGMVQRLGLAQAVQHDPDLVILDEPMSGLDPIGRRDVRDLILALRAAGKTVFFSSHILQDAEMICDRVAILQRGQLRDIGRLDAMTGREVLWFEVAFRGRLPEGLPAEVVNRRGDHLLVRLPDVDALTALLASVRQEGGQVLSIWPRRESLEDVFLKKIASPVGQEGER